MDSTAAADRSFSETTILRAHVHAPLEAPPPASYPGNGVVVERTRKPNVIVRVSVTKTVDASLASHLKETRVDAKRPSAAMKHAE